MPELPEVETVLRTLEHQIQGRRILDVDVRYPKMIENDVEQFKQQLKNQTFQTFMRRGKYLLFGLDDYILMSHLRMEGRYYIQDPTEPTNRHMHVIFHLDNGKELRYMDTVSYTHLDVYKRQPYVWGGASPSGFDCSGLVKYCYGISQRTTYTHVSYTHLDVYKRQILHSMLSQLRTGNEQRMK